MLTHLEEPKAPTPVVEPTEVAQLRPRPHVLTGATYRAPTPVGTAFVTINSDADGNFCEVFITVGRAGSDVAADAEALGRLISLGYRIPSGLSTISITEAVIDQLSGIGGSNSLGFGNARVRSLADAVAKVLGEHLAIARKQNGPVPMAIGEDGTLMPSHSVGSPMAVGVAKAAGNGNGHGNGPAVITKNRVTGDFCPSCGQIALVNEEGCHKCYVCGFSSC